MGVASVLVKTALGGTKHVTPAVNPLCLVQYEKVKITKTGHLWGYLRLRLIEGAPQGLVKENIGYIGAGYQIESMTNQLIVLKTPKRGLILAEEFARPTQGNTWQPIKK